MRTSFLKLSCLLAVIILLGLSASQPALAAYTETLQLVPSDPAAANEMGYAVASAGTIALVGVPGDADRGINSGSAYIFRRESSSVWTKEGKLTAPDASVGDRFGSAVELSGQYMVIAAPAQNGNQGAAYVYEDKAGKWVFVVKLTANDGAPSDEFGAAIAIGSGTPSTITRIVIGAPGKGAGVVYVFEIDSNVTTPTWTQVNKLTAADGNTGDRFGASVYTNRLTPGDLTIIGAPNDDDIGTDSGSVYVYLWTGTNIWTQEDKFTGDNTAAGDHFGQSVSNAYASGSITLLVGAPDADSLVLPRM